MKVKVVVHPAKQEALDAFERIREIAPAKGIELIEADDPQTANAVIALGGDGTILRAATVALQDDAPLAGINLGRLGFLSTANVDGCEDLLAKIATRDFTIQGRLMLTASVRSPGERIEDLTALNDVVLEREAQSRVIPVDLTIDGEHVTTYQADGFIVSTPTGSTAYSLSAGGPIVEPEMLSIVLTPVCSHMPLWRPIVVDASRRIRLATDEPAGLSADGVHRCALKGGGEVRITAHPRRLKLIQISTKGFYEKLRSRFSPG